MCADREEKSRDAPGGWVFVRDRDAELPEAWRERVVQVWLVPLTPDETRTLMEESTLRSQLSSDDAEIATLLATGLSATAIASRTGKSLRTVHRRLAGLRELLQTTSTAELAVLLARRGF